MERPARMHRGVLLLTGTVVALVGAFVWVQLTSPSDGARMDFVRDQDAWQGDGLLVRPWEEEPSGLRSGDVVVAVEGRAISTIARSLASPREWRSLGRVGQTVTYTVLRDGRPVAVEVRLRPYPLRRFLDRAWSPILSVVVFLLIALVVYAKRPAEPAALALLLGAVGLFADVTYYFGLQVGDLVGGVGFWLEEITELGYVLFAIALLHFWLVFPTPRGVIGRRPRLLPGLYAGTFAFVGIAGLASRWGSASILDWFNYMGLVGGLTSLVLIATALGLAVAAYRSARDPVGRRRVRWVASAAIFSIAALAVWTVLQAVLDHGRLLTWLPPLFLGLPLPLAVAVAILRHHLFDIDVVLNRTLVWATLSAFVVGTYGLIVGYLGTRLREGEDLALSILATGLVAVLFQPLRERVQRVVNRFVYGERDDPYAVVSRLGRRLEATLAPEEILPTIVETVAQALRLPYVAVALGQGDGLRVVAAHGTPGGAALIVPLVYQSEAVGHVALAPRAPGERFTAADRRLLDDLARQVGVAAHAVRLTGDVQRSRQRLVTAREEERRRIRRDLHDGLGPSLASITLKLDAARNLLSRDPTVVDALLLDLKGQAQAAIADVRRVVYDLRPPALDELGLVSALREHAARVAGATPDGPTLRVAVEAPAVLPPLPAAVEVAAYRIALEALTNVVRHAGARECVLRLSLGEAFLVEVADDGRGVPVDVRPGVGLTSMRERAEELGGRLTIAASAAGGTCVAAWLPLPAEA